MFRILKTRVLGTFGLITSYVMLFFIGACQSGQELPSDWIKVPIQACIDSNEKLIGRTDAIDVYCNCMIPKIYEQVKSDKRKVKMMQEGDLDFIKHATDASFSEIAEQCKPERVDVGNKTPLKDLMMPHMERGIKIGLRDEMIQKGMADKINIDHYCDCMLEGIKKEFTMGEFAKRDVAQSEKYKKIEKTCMEGATKR